VCVRSPPYLLLVTGVRLAPPGSSLVEATFAPAQPPLMVTELLGEKTNQPECIYLMYLKCILIAPSPGLCSRRARPVSAIFRDETCPRRELSLSMCADGGAALLALAAAGTFEKIATDSRHASSGRQVKSSQVSKQHILFLSAHSFLLCWLPEYSFALV
jgi:hypothetical protein